MPTSTSLATDRTARPRPRCRTSILQLAAICSHSAMSQYFPTRFHASAAGRSMAMSRANDQIGRIVDHDVRVRRGRRLRGRRRCLGGECEGDTGQRHRCNSDCRDGYSAHRKSSGRETGRSVVGADCRRRANIGHCLPRRLSPRQAKHMMLLCSPCSLHTLPHLYTYLRIVAGLLFVQHGVQKLLGWLGGTRVPIASQMGVAGIIETFGGLGIRAGRVHDSAQRSWRAGSGRRVPSRPTCHGDGRPIQNGGELAVLNCFLFLSIASRGAGKWSVRSAAADPPARCLTWVARHLGGPMETLAARRSARPAPVVARPRLHLRGGRRAGARHRRQHGDLFGRQHGPAEAAALPGPRAPGVVPQHLAAGLGAGASPTKFNIWRRQTAAFQDVSAYRFSVVNLTGDANPEQIATAHVSADFFRLFGAPRSPAAPSRRTKTGPAAAHAWCSATASGDAASAATRAPSAARSRSTASRTRSSACSARSTPKAIQSPTGAPDVWLPFQIDPNSTMQGHFFTDAPAA